MWNTILLTIGIVAIAFILLGIKVIFVKNGHFPNSHIGSNKEMKKRGISCAMTTDLKDRNRKRLSDLINEN
ncbi:MULTISPECIES: hypothetical protein [Bacteroidales]|jgi:hypothetical protein|uniref:Uncharacterized protein n=1 Tax=Coprobacter secundus subsp. similis TaxID=2751153 RepID=A0A7G1HV94_9BACT|nr:MULTISPECIES: hypothetical protein [Bacteroidales]KHM48709.1 membrane protein [Coprobacter secundus]BCI63470.1 hypothetical protein Cop2CBH44_18230 [Coprobacter secundus subsp. similis]CCY36360.1 putative uncharacterized protein [Tannerella sp. CAG:118]